MSNWVVGYNMPGYMPDNPPEIFDNWLDAKNYLKSELESDLDIELTPDYDEQNHLTITRLQEAIIELEELNPDRSFSYIARNTCYWLEPTEEKMEGQE